jgi:hypothetical protein
MKKASVKLLRVLTIAAVLFAGAGATPAHAATGKSGSGYWMLGVDGSVYAFGSALNCGHYPYGDAVDIIAAPDGLGYWVLDAIGFVDFIDCAAMPDAHWFSYERSNLFADQLQFDEVAVSMSALPDGSGYWVFTNKGRAFAFGNAQWYGDMGNIKLNGPILDSVATPSGRGYWMVASDGGIFSFGDAQFYGSMGGHKLNAPVNAMAPDPDGRGYWLVAADGGIFAFDAPFYGSMGGAPLNESIAAIVASPTGRGYLMVAFDGGTFTFGDVPFHGSLGANPPAFPVFSIAVMP